MLSNQTKEDYKTFKENHVIQFMNICISQRRNIRINIKFMNVL